jgi:hypothetical protein
MRRPRQLKDENGKPRKSMMKRSLDKEILCRMRFAGDCGA